MKNDTLGIMYLAEESSPADYSIKDLNVYNESGCFWVEFTAVLHSFDVLNRNKRMYDSSNVQECLRNDERISSWLKNNSWYGEMDHPVQIYENQPLTSKRIMDIYMPNRSHKILNPEFKNNNLYATIQTCSGTECGIGMARDIIQGLIPSFSCRSIAIMKQKNGKPYVLMKKLITYDWVLFPSHKEAEMVTKPEFKIPNTANTTNTSQSTQPAFEFISLNKSYSEDTCIDMNEFSDFTKDISESCDNLAMVLESYGLTYNDIIGYRNKYTPVIENAGNQIYINIDLDTKNKIDDFLSSF